MPTNKRDLGIPDFDKQKETKYTKFTPGDSKPDLLFEGKPWLAKKGETKTELEARAKGSDETELKDA